MVIRISRELAELEPESYELAVEFLRLRKHGRHLSVAEFLSEVPAADDRVRALLETSLSWPQDEAIAALRRHITRIGTRRKATESGSTSDTGADATTPAGADPRGDDDSKTGKILDGRYRVVRLLGKGAFGRVFLVEDLYHPGQRLALKLIRPRRSGADELESRFRKEIQLLRGLNHPGIPRIFNDGKSTDGEIYYSMSYVEGQTLESLLARGKSLSHKRALLYLRRLLEVLSYAHSCGIVHRDLKPSNIMVRGQAAQVPEVYVLDFGIAKLLDSAQSSEITSGVKTLTPIGTPMYMAPEQLRGQPVDASADMYAIGLIAHRMLSGKLPFDTSNALDLLAARASSKPPRLSAAVRPRWVQRWVLRCLSADPAARPSAAESFRLFEAALRPRKLRNALIGLSLLLGVAGAVPATVWALRHPDGWFEVRAATVEGWTRFVNWLEATPEPRLALHPGLRLLIDEGAGRVRVRGEQVSIEGKVLDPRSESVSLCVDGGSETVIPLSSDGSFEFVFAPDDDGVHELEWTTVGLAESVRFAAQTDAVGPSIELATALTASMTERPTDIRVVVDDASPVPDVAIDLNGRPCSARRSDDSPSEWFVAADDCRQGLNELVVRASDDLGNAAEPVKATFELDCVGPAPPRVVPPLDEALVGRELKVRLNFQEPVRDVVIGKQSAFPVDGDEQVFDYSTTLSASQREFLLPWRAEDERGNRTEGALRWAIDADAPEPSIELLAEPPRHTRTNPLHLAFNVRSRYPIDEPFVEVDDVRRPERVVQRAGGEWTVDVPLAPRLQAVRLVVVDAWGREASQVREVILDEQKPRIVAAEPSEGTKLALGSHAVKFQVDEPVAALRVDGVEVGAEDGWYSAVVEATAEANVIGLRWSATDLAGNTEPDGVLRWSVEPSAPPAIDLPRRCVRLVGADRRLHEWFLPEALTWAPGTRGGSSVIVTSKSGRDRSEMVLVPALEAPGAAITTPFLIDVDEVSLERYRGFLKSSAFLLPSGNEGGDVAEDRVSVKNLGFGDAGAFAEFADRQIPTETEWLVAAAWDPERNAWRNFTWGDDFAARGFVLHRDRDRVAFADLETDLSAFGVRGMGSGLKEWCCADGASKPSILQGGTSLWVVPPLCDPDRYLRDHWGEQLSERFRVRRSSLAPTRPLNAMPRPIGLRCIVRLEKREP